MIVRLPHVQRLRDRHGTVRHYFRKPGCPRATLPGEPGSPEFLAAYRAALAAMAVPKQRAAEGSFEALVISWYGSPKFTQLGPSTQRVYRRIAERMRVKYGPLPVRMLEAQKIQEIIEALVKTPAAGNHVLRMFRALLEHGVKTKVRPDNPAKTVDRLKERREEIHTWNEAEIAAYEAHWPTGSRPRLALALLLYTAQRRSDVVRMGRQHVRAGSIDVRQVKTRARLSIPLHSELRAELDRVPAEHLTFLTTAAGAAFTAGGFYNAFVGWTAEAGLPAGCSPHGLRKAACRRLAEAGCTPHEIMSISGHKTLSEVERYTRAADQARLAGSAIERIGVNPSRRSTVNPGSTD